MTLHLLGQKYFSIVNALKSFTVPEKVTVLPDWAFYYCKSLSRIVLHDGVKRIRRTMFH